MPDFGVYIKAQGPTGNVEYRAISRQLVLFCVERRKAWRMLQSKAGIENREYKAQRALLADVDSGKVSKEDFLAHAELMLKDVGLALDLAKGVGATSLMGGLAQQLYAAYRSAGLTLGEFEGPRYQRIGHIRALLATKEIDKNLRWRLPASPREMLTKSA